jgi:hypothetical protein
MQKMRHLIYTPLLALFTAYDYIPKTWVLKEAIIQKLLVFERKILRRIFGPTKDNQIWRVKTNEELDN